MVVEINRELLEAAFPVEVGVRTLEFVGVEESSEGPALAFRLCEFDDESRESIREIVEQPVPVRVLGSSDPAVLAARVRERLGNPALENPFPIDLLVRPFEPIFVAGDLHPVDAEWAAYDALNAQAHDAGFVRRTERVAVWPDAARTLYYLSRVHGTVGGNGFESFLGQGDLDDIVGVLEALEAAGCERLAVRLRQGLRLAWNEGAEFTVQTDGDWIEERGLEVPDGTERPWLRIDGHEEGRTYWLIKHELTPKSAAYFAARRAEITSS